MNYETLIDELLSVFPELRKEYEENEHLIGLPHCVFDMLLEPYFINAIRHDNTAILKKLTDFLERMAISEDSRIVNVLNVSVLEPLVLDGVTADLYTYLGPQTLHELSYWLKLY